MEVTVKKKMFRHIPVLIIGILLVVGAPGKAFAADFYKGKMIRFVLGFSPGGGYDTYSRAIGRHFSKHVPGNPTIIVENRTGAGSMIAANYVYKKAKPDGQTLGIWSSDLVLRLALGQKGIQFDPKKLNWIGTPTKDTPICGVMGFTGLRTLDDVLKRKKPLRVGSTGSGTTDGLPRNLNKTVGNIFEIITGYRGTATIRLALQRRELEGICFTWESMRVTARSMLDAEGDDKLIPFIIHRKWNDPEVRNLPLVTNVIKGKDNLDTYKAWVSVYEFFRPFSAPPGVPKNRVEILRKAFKATLEDPAFMAEMKKARLPVAYVSPKEIEQHVDRIFSMPQKVKENLHFLVKGRERKS
jgi:tripartite-type tricarboxylate transporter receptor subunit TctC